MKNSKLIGGILFLIIVLQVPVFVFLSQHQQVFNQHAEKSDHPLTGPQDEQHENQHAADHEQNNHPPQSHGNNDHKPPITSPTPFHTQTSASTTSQLITYNTTNTYTTISHPVITQIILPSFTPTPTPHFIPASTTTSAVCLKPIPIKNITITCPNCKN